MLWVDLQKPYRDKALVQDLCQRIRDLAAKRPTYTFMEVCGTHTQAIGRWGLRRLLPANVRLVSGPGCPVCVTPGTYIDQACALALDQGAILATFGDLIRVPGERTSLERAMAEGADVRTLYSVHDVLELARATTRPVVFLAVGFETTAAGIAATVAAARAQGIANLSFYLAVKRVPPALVALIQDPEVAVDGFILPGHVSAILGKAPYAVLTEHGRPGAIAGFEPVDVLRAVEALLHAVNEGSAEVTNLYGRAVRDQGNAKACAQMDAVFSPAEAVWRGIGSIPASGSELRPAYADLDATRRFGLPALTPTLASGCVCGDVLRGKITPPDCPLFGKACTPAAPVGPCMVSSEGSCSAWYQYGL